MIVTSFSFLGQSLPPNRRVKRRKTPARPIEAFDERVLLGLEMPDEDGDDDEPHTDEAEPLKEVTARPLHVTRMFDGGCRAGRSAHAASPSTP